MSSQRVALALGVFVAAVASASSDRKFAEPLAVAEIAARGGPAVVVLRVHSDDGVARYGSGFLVDSSGTIVTALHLLDGADRLLVRTADGRRYRQIRIRTFDIASDLAILQIDGSNLPVVRVGRAGDLAPGASLVIIGNPLALTRTVTEGVLGAWREPSPNPDELPLEELEEDREFGPRRRVRAVPNTRILQLSVAISPGSSGAPVFASSGEVIGMAVAGISYGELGLNFAIPAELIAPLLEPDEGLTLASFQQQADLVRADLAEPHIAEARLALELGRLDDAQREIDAALQLFPVSAEALRTEAELLRRRGEFEDAERSLLEAARYEPESADTWYRLGQLYVEAVRGTGHSLGPAKVYYEMALDLDEDLAPAAHGLGVIAYREGRFLSAARLFERARRAEADGAATSRWLGETYLRTDRSHDAEACFREALDIEPDNPLVHHGLARTYVAMGLIGRARDHYREFFDLTSGSPELAALRERTELYLRRNPHLMPAR